MKNKNKYTLGDDLPKQDPSQDDRLGYAPFAKRISMIIADITAPNGYVIGLHGQWGSGKSTVINFIIHYLKCGAEPERISHIDFRPWIVSGHQDLVGAFFKILSERLGPADGWWKRRWKWVSRSIYGSTDNLIDAAATVALTVDPSGGVASKLAGSLTKKSLNSILGRFLAEPSLQKAYENLKEQLARSGRRFLVTIDDIDRLEDAEVNAIMQMVKSIGQLPNVIYLLAYDREIVRQVLDRGVDRAGPRFAEKIVQQEIELPKPAQTALLKLLDQELTFLPPASEESTRWHYILRDGIYRWIRSPRDVIRLSNAVKFSWPALEGEIDPQDLLAIEGLRLFDEGVFYWIRESRDFLFTEGRFILAEDEVKKAAVDDLKRRIRENVQSQVLRVMSTLFPQSAKLFEGRSFSEEPFTEIAKRRGIGNADGYDTYFGMHPSTDAIPRAVVNNLMSRLEDVDGIEAIIRYYIGSENARGEMLVSKLLQELRIQYQARQPAQPTQALLDALFRVGEDIIGIDWNGDPFTLSPRGQIGFLIQNMLEQWGLDEAGQHLIEAFEKGKSPAFLADVYVDRGRELRIFKSDSSERPLITHEDFETLGKILVKKIRIAAKDGALEKAPFYFDIIRSWAYLDGQEVVKAWIANGVKESVAFMAKVGRGMVGYSISARGREYSMNEKPADIYDLQTLIDAGRRHLERSDATQDQRNLIDVIVRGSKRFLQEQGNL